MKLLTSIVTAPVYFKSETPMPLCVIVFRIYSEESCFKCPPEVGVFYSVCVTISSKFLKVNICLKI